VEVIVDTCSRVEGENDIMEARVDANVGHVDEVTQDEAVEQVT
jgi:hypothetical protein